MNDSQVVIGIPRAFLYYKYGDLWENFFYELGFDIMYSPETNQEILEKGKSLSVDESCLSLKIFMGHVNYLIDKVDYILIPRIYSLKKKEKLCIVFSSLYDIVNNVFDTNILNYNVDVENGKREQKAFIKMGVELGKGYFVSLRAYKKAKRIAKRVAKHKFIRQHQLILTSKKLKILLVAHSYNSYDKLIAEPIVKCLRDLDIDVIYADIFNEEETEDRYKSISTSIYWTYNKELMSSIVYYQKYVDGIILLSSFPCGPDALTNEISMRKLTLPTINIIVDELSGDIGLHTRIESFIDVIKEKKKVNTSGKENN